MRTQSLLSLGVITAALLFIGAACSKGTTTTTTNVTTGINSAANTALDTSNVNAAGVMAAENISLTNLAFSPATITVKKGTKITWTNNDSTSHTVTSTSGSELSSATLTSGKSYSHTFDSAGTFTYRCSFHPAMTGTVIVTE